MHYEDNCFLFSYKQENQVFIYTRLEADEIRFQYCMDNIIDHSQRHKVIFLNM